MILRILPSVIACLMLGAHFLRSGNVLLATIVVFFPTLLLFRKRWSFLAVQIMDYAGAIVWVATGLGIVSERIATQRSWGIAAVILGLAASFSIVSGILLKSCYSREGCV